MTSDWVALGGERSVAKYQAVADSGEVTAQVKGGAALQWVLMKDVDKSSGYQTPLPPNESPEYEGQVVVVPAVLEVTQS